MYIKTIFKESFEDKYIEGNTVQLNIFNMSILANHSGRKVITMGLINSSKKPLVLFSDDKTKNMNIPKDVLDHYSLMIIPDNAFCYLINQINEMTIKEFSNV